jgi:hypothetical protein
MLQRNTIETKEQEGNRSAKLTRIPSVVVLYVYMSQDKAKY